MSGHPSGSGGPAADDGAETVITPGGPRARHLVTAVGPGQAVYVTQQGGLVMTANENQNPPDEFVLTPGGYRHKSLVHPVQAGVAVNVATDVIRLMENENVIEEIPASPTAPGTVPALGSGWITYFYWNNGTGTPVSSFSTMWQVPPPPSVQDSGEVVFLFNGIQNYGANFGILQPVLQWGVSAAGGGAYWSVASWYVTSGGQAFHTSLVRVNPDDTLIGVMTLTGQNGTAFSYTSQFQGIAGTELPVQNIAELMWCNETLEAYGINAAGNYPNTPLTEFTEINIRTGAAVPAITWTPVDRVTDTGQHGVVDSNSASYGEVDIFYSGALANLELCSVQQNADGRLEAFAVGTDNGLWHIWETTPNGGWSGWASLGGVITSEPTVGRNADGRLEVFARGTDNALWHIWQTAPSAGPWSGWASLGGVITSRPAVGNDADGRLEVFARGTDDALWHIWQTAPSAGPWSGWASLGGVITSEPKLSNDPDGRLEVFARGTDNALWHIWQTAPNNGWSAWSSLGGVITSNVSIQRNADGRLEAFVRGTDSALWHIWQTAPGGGPWSGWASLGGVITSDPACGHDEDGRLEVFARGTDNALWHVWQTAPSAGPWSGWASLGGVITSSPTVSNDANGSLQAFARGTDDALWHIWQTAPNNGWSGWASLGGKLFTL
jgi:acylphosphatase